MVDFCVFVMALLTGPQRTLYRDRSIHALQRCFQWLLVCLNIILMLNMILIDYRHLCDPDQH